VSLNPILRSAKTPNNDGNGTSVRGQVHVSSSRFRLGAQERGWSDNKELKIEN
jgi:hypothetical protein